MSELSKLFGVPDQSIGVSIEVKKPTVIEQVRSVETTVATESKPVASQTKPVEMMRLDELGRSGQHHRGRTMPEVAGFLGMYGYDSSEYGWGDA